MISICVGIVVAKFQHFEVLVIILQQSQKVSSVPTKLVILVIVIKLYRRTLLQSILQYNDIYHVLPN